VLEIGIGDEVGEGDVIGTVHARGQDEADGAAAAVLDALTFRDPPVDAPPLVLDHLPAEPHARG